MLLQLIHQEAYSNGALNEVTDLQAPRELYTPNPV